MSDLDFGEMHRELAEEFFYYADQRGRSYLSALMLEYWRARAVDVAACVANLPGSKFLVSTDEVDGLTDSVRKALMFTDHVVIRHRTLLPVTGLILGAFPADFAGFGRLKWVDSHIDGLQGARVLPHFRGSPPPEAIDPFIEWLCGEGRGWFQSGQVTYAPIVVPGEVDLALLGEDTNINKFFRAANVLPQEDRRLNPKAAAALAHVDIPYLNEITPDLLVSFKQEEAECIDRFRRHLLALFEDMPEDTTSPEFARAVERTSDGLLEGTRALESAVHRQARSSSWQRVGIEVLTLSAMISFWSGVSAGGIAGLTAAALAFAKKMADDIKEEHSLKADPHYAMGRLGAISKSGSAHGLAVKAPPELRKR